MLPFARKKDSKRSLGHLYHRPTWGHRKMHGETWSLALLWLLLSPSGHNLLTGKQGASPGDSRARTELLQPAQQWPDPSLSVLGQRGAKRPAPSCPGEAQACTSGAEALLSCLCPAPRCLTFAGMSLGKEKKVILNYSPSVVRLRGFIKREKAQRAANQLLLTNEVLEIDFSSD